MTPVFVAEPHTPVWHKARAEGIGASEIAAVLGLSPFESRFSLWWRKREGWHLEETAAMEAGTRAEPVIVDWFADRHTEVLVGPGSLYAHPGRRWQLATPDGLLWRLCDSCAGRGGNAVTGGLCADCGGFRAKDDLDEDLVGLVEAKYVIGGWHGWGEPGTDDIPVHYRCQALWQADVLNVDLVFVAAWHGAEFREYLVRRDEKDLRVMRAAAGRFVADLRNGVEPDVDEHTATLAALKRIHPTLEDRDAEITPATAEGYRRARAAKARADCMAARFEARLRHEMGAARRAVCEGRFVASRSVFDRTDERYEINALDEGFPTTDRLNPARR